MATKTKIMFIFETFVLCALVKFQVYSPEVSCADTCLQLCQIYPLSHFAASPLYNLHTIHQIYVSA